MRITKAVLESRLRFIKRMLFVIAVIFFLASAIAFNIGKNIGMARQYEFDKYNFNAVIQSNAESIKELVAKNIVLMQDNLQLEHNLKLCNKEIIDCGNGIFLDNSAGLFESCNTNKPPEIISISGKIFSVSPFCPDDKPYERQTICECAKNTNTPCMAYCFECISESEITAGD